MTTLRGSHGPTARQQWLVLSFCALLMAGSARPVHSQSQTYIYPAKGQNQQQQDKDRYECHTWAVQQSGFDPSKAYSGNPNYYDPQPYNPSQPHVMRGAGRGAAMGAVGGAIGGNAGKGAAAGAAVGAMAGGFRRRDERRQQAAAQQQQQAQASASVPAGYQRAMAACLQGRGYTVN
jgi:Glycine zipper